VQFTNKYQSSLEIGGTPGAFRGTEGFRATLVEKQCSRGKKSYFEVLKYISL